MPESRFQQALQEFNRQEFFDCHETLEALWKDLPEGDQKLFYQGLLQVAVGFYHWQQGNFTGTINLLTRGLTKLESLQHQTACQSWIRLAPFLLELRQRLEELEASGHLIDCHFPQIESP